MLQSTAGFYNAMLAYAIAYARIAPIFFLLPIFSDRALVGTVLKNTVILAVVIGLGPALPVVRGDAGAVFLLLLALKEAAVGLVVGASLALPFWVASAIGEMIDNERGATMADSIDPASGVESSVTGPFIGLCYTTLFLQEGGMRKIVEVLAESYQYVGAGGVIEGNVLRLGGLLNDVVGKGLVMAAPVLITTFLTDALLGLVSRFCPQLNAFSISTSVKSIIAFSVFLMYFGIAIPGSLTELLGAHPFRSLLTSPHG
ncbi:type III secretion system protein [Burkholderia ubonensis]|uniref:type III secretion system export apparatus subunit SctT n=1 Tax=Burkholderia ubonensis TaxID=101571 RepID=UPI00075CD40C|nr:type III secretion system export apparatus subunit SctT [Burkholderia ubonensis]KVN98550.1 type III secretion system protein [Burkholderia ubonensis]